MPRSRKAPRARTASAAPQDAVSTGIGPLRPGVPALTILETDFVNTPLPNRQGDWAKKSVRGHVFMEVPGPAFGWQNLHDAGNEFDVPLTGLSGTVVQDPHVSTSDMPFLHPFGNDFEFHVAPDEAYADLVAPKMKDNLYIDSTRRAKTQFNLNAEGVIGMEIESGLVPTDYRAQLGDRTCLWGRWIVDAGHDDFHTEIHSPLIMVNARPGRSRQQKRAGGSQGRDDATTVDILTRPFLVSQDFGDGGLLEHLIKEVAKVEGIGPIPLSTLVEAHPQLLPTPFTGLNIVTFKVRPPAPRADPRDQLWVEFKFTRRDDSTAVQVLRGSDQDSVRVILVLNEAGYIPPPEPRRIKRRYSLPQIKQLSAKAGTVMEGIIFFNLLHDPAKAFIIHRGIETHEYPKLTAPRLGSAKRVRVDQLGPVDTIIDNGQPFPIAGKLTVEWRRFGVAPSQGSVKRASRG